MPQPQEFHYRLPQRLAGARPGIHPGSGLGAGADFVTHARLHDRPDPRRLDLRASLRNLNGEWLVRVHRQNASIAVHLLVDVSASMAFGASASKLEIAARFALALGHSTWRADDALGLVAFDAQPRDDLFLPARRGRGVGDEIASLLRSCETRAGGIEGLEQAALRLAGRRGLVFLMSDFHWPLDRLGGVLDRLGPAMVVPMVVWDPAETEPPADNAIARLRDAETGRLRTLWLRPALRERWRERVAARRDELEALFRHHRLRPFLCAGGFEAEAMTRYFLELQR